MGKDETAPPIVHGTTNWLWKNKDAFILAILAALLGALGTWFLSMARWVQDAVAEKAASKLVEDPEFVARVGGLVGRLPIGAVVGWPSMEPIPAGWLECDGVAFSAEKSASIVKVLGATGVGKHVSVMPPNYAGVFLRGFDKSKIVDKDDRRLGDVQQDSVGFHEKYRLMASDIVLKTESMPKDWVLNEPPEAHTNSKRLAASRILESPRELARPPVETRPVNRSIRWIIRVE
jgi:hypothetical protein